MHQKTVFYFIHVLPVLSVLPVFSVLPVLSVAISGNCMGKDGNNLKCGGPCSPPPPLIFGLTSEYFCENFWKRSFFFVENVSFIWSTFVRKSNSILGCPACVCETECGWGLCRWHNLANKTKSCFCDYLAEGW